MIIYLYGPDSWRRNRKLQELLGQYRKKYAQLDLLEIDLEERPEDWSKIGEFLEQPSMFVESKVAVIRESGAVERKEWRKILRDHIKTEKIFLLISDRSGPKADFRFLKEKGKVFLSLEFKELAGAEFASWIKKEAVSRGLDFNPAAWRYFIDYLGSLTEGRSWAAIQELEKIALASLPQPITPEDLRPVTVWFSAEDFQDLVNPLFRSFDWRRRLFLTEKLFLQKEDPAHVFNALAYRTHGRQLVKFADYDIAVKSGLVDYESAIFDFALAVGDSSGV